MGSTNTYRVTISQTLETDGVKRGAAETERIFGGMSRSVIAHIKRMNDALNNSSAFRVLHERIRLTEDAYSRLPQHAQRAAAAQTRAFEQSTAAQVRAVEKVSQAVQRADAAGLRDFQKTHKEQVRIAAESAKASAQGYEKELGSGFFAKLGRAATHSFREGFRIGGETFGGGGSGVSGLVSGALGVAGGNLITSVLSGVTNQITGAIKTGFDFNKLKEQTLLGFEIKLKGREEARRFFDEVSQFAEKTPLELDQALTSVQRLMATFSAPEALATIKAVTDAVAAQGKVGGEAREQIDGIGLALQQIRLKGKVSAEELTQLAERQVNGWKYLGDEIARTDRQFATLTDDERIARVQQLAQKGLLEARTAVAVIIRGMQEEFGGTAERIAKETAAGLESNISDVFSRSAGIATESAFERYKQGLQKFYDLLQTGAAERVAGGISATTGKVFDAMESALSALKSGNIKQLGLDAVTSAASGVTQGAQNLYNSGVNAASQLEQGWRDRLIQHSPSQVLLKLGYEAGLSLSQGFEQGLKGARRIVDDQFRDMQKLIEENARRTGIDPNLIRAIIEQESSGRTRAISPKGAQGLMQLMPGTAARFGVTNPFDPAQSIRGGTDYLRFLLDRFGGNIPLALAGYNAGEGAVEKYGNRIPPYGETQEYVRRVMSRLQDNGAGALLNETHRNPLASAGQWEETYERLSDGTLRRIPPGQRTGYEYKYQRRTYQDEERIGLMQRELREFSDANPLPVRVINKFRETGVEGLGSNTFYESGIEGFDYFTGISRDQARRAVEIINQARGANQLLTTDISNLAMTVTPRALESIKSVAAETGSAFENLPPLIKRSATDAKELQQQMKDVAKGVASIVGDAVPALLSGRLRDAFGSIRRDFSSMLLGMGRDLVTSRVYKALSGDGAGGIFGNLFKRIFGGGSIGPGGTAPFNPSAGLSAAGAFVAPGGASFSGGLGSPQALIAQRAADFFGGGITAPVSLTQQAQQQAAVASAVSGAAKTGFGALFQSGGLLSGIGFGAKAGTGGALAAALPLLGAGLGLQLGGGRGLSGALGLIGGGLLGVGLTATPAIFAAGGSLAGLGGVAGALFSNPITAIAGGALLVGALLLGRSKQRRTDEQARDQLREEAYAQLNQILDELRRGKLADPLSAVVAARAVVDGYYRQISQVIKTKSVQQSAENFRPYFNQRVEQIRREAERQLQNQGRAGRLIPEFDMGGTVPFMNNLHTLIKVRPGEKFIYPSEFRNNIVPGVDRGADSVYTVAPVGTRVLTRAQQLSNGGTVGGESTGVSGEPDVINIQLFLDEDGLAARLLNSRTGRKTVLNVMASTAGQDVTRFNTRRLKVHREL